jgi:hypothetical protein
VTREPREPLTCLIVILLQSKKKINYKEIKKRKLEYIKIKICHWIVITYSFSMLLKKIAKLNSAFSEVLGLVIIPIKIFFLN